MKIFKAVYRHGKLYDTNSKKRIIINENAILSLTINDLDLANEDPYNKSLQGKNNEILQMEIFNKNYYSYKICGYTNDLLKFNIKAGKNTQTKKYSIECTFQLRLLNDLYLFQKTKDSKHGFVYPCDCVVESVSGSLDYFEPIYAYSLNDAYMKTYDFYFALFGKPTANIYNKFSLVKEHKDISLASLRMF